MRQPWRQRTTSLRAPDGSMARLATHIDIAGVAAKRRWTLIREAALLNWRVSTTGGAALRGGLDELLLLPPEEVHNIALAYTACEPYLQTALRVRLAHLSTYATHRQKQLFLKLIPRVGERLPSAFEPLLMEHPELVGWSEGREPNDVFGRPFPYRFATCAVDTTTSVTEPSQLRGRRRC
jgi:hypothetical protein